MMSRWSLLRRAIRDNGLPATVRPARAAFTRNSLRKPHDSDARAASAVGARIDRGA